MYAASTTPSFTAIANGTIAAFSIVRQDPANDDQVVQCSTNQLPIGVTDRYSTATGVALPVFQTGIHLVQLGSGGCSQGQNLVSDASGFAVVAGTASATNENRIGIARRSGNSGDIIPVEIDLAMYTGANTVS